MLRIIWPALAAMLLLAPVSALAISEDEFRDQVNAMRNKGDNPQELIDFIQKSIAESPEASPKMLSNAQAALGEAYGKLGQIDKGIAYCEEALKIKETVFANIQLANLFLAKKEYSDAYTYLEKSIALAKDDSERERLKKHAHNIINKYLAVSATKLYAAFDENEVAAEDEYKDKKIFVNGKISAITTDPAGHPVVTLWAGENILAKVNCVFSKDERSVVAKLKKGGETTIQGKCDGMTLGTVFIKNCVIDE